MFSSNRLIPPSTNPFSPCSSLFDDEKDDIVYSNNHPMTGDPFISGEFLFHSYTSPPPPVVAEDVSTVTTLKQDGVTQQQFSEGSGLHYSEDHDDILDSVNYRYKKKMETSKKDGHSKIYTARGPRDRRVRLSIEIARKFFCLQDLLGFDKASKTLDWLLTKSMSAIKDLVEETNHCSSSTLTDQSEVKFMDTIKGGLDEDDGPKKRSVVPKCVDGKKKKMTRRFKARFQENVARDQSRAEARARARERTKEKMRLKNLLDEPPSDYNHFRCECIMNQETLVQSKDSSFIQQGDHHGVHNSDLKRSLK